VLKPDPPHTFGLFLLGTVLLATLATMERFFAFWYMAGELVKFDTWLGSLVEHLPLLKSLDQYHF